MNDAAWLTIDDDLKLIKLRGTLSFATSMGIFNQTLPIIEQLQPQAAIDFSEIDCIDSSIIALLVEWCKLMRFGQQQLRIRNLPGHILSLLHIAGLDEVLKELFIA